MRAMASGAAFHRAYLHATQQAFLEAHELAFAYFGGVFRLLRYDNLASAVRKILRGHRREETVRFVAFRSHWRFAAEFCTPWRGAREGRRRRRRRLLPAQPPGAGAARRRPRCAERAAADGLPRGRGAHPRRAHARRSARRWRWSATICCHARPKGFDLAEVVFPLVDKQGCVTVKTNFYSVPARAGSRVEARVHPLHVEVWHAGRRIARHERCHSRRQHVLDLEHYLDVLSHKPGAFAGSKPLEQWREAGRWPACYDELWAQLRERHGKQNGTRAMMAVLALGREFGHDRLRAAVATALSLGACDVAAVRYLLTEAGVAQSHARADRCRRTGPLRPAAAERRRLRHAAYRRRARGRHDERAAGPGHSAALQGAAHADDRQPVRPPGGGRHPGRTIPSRLSRGAAGGRDGGAREPRDRAAAARGPAAADEDARGVRVRPLRRLGGATAHAGRGRLRQPRRSRSCWSARPGRGRPIWRRGLCVAACRQRRRVRFTTATALVNELAEAAHANQLSRALGRWERLDLICIDELGYVPLAETACELMFQVIADRAEKAAVIVTTNLPFSEWSQVIPNPRLCKALIDRLTDQAHIITTGTDSYRFRRTTAQRKAAKA